MMGRDREVNIRLTTAESFIYEFAETYEIVEISMNNEENLT